MLIDAKGRNRHVLTTGVPFLREIERRRTSVHRIAAPPRSRDDQCDTHAAGRRTSALLRRVVDATARNTVREGTLYDALMRL
jgi:hypothetical protein